MAEKKKWGGGGFATAAGLAVGAGGLFEIIRNIFGEEAVRQGAARLVDRMNIHEAWLEVKAMVADLHRTIANWPVKVPEVGPVTPPPAGGGKKGKGPSGSKYRFIEVEGTPRTVDASEATRRKARFAELIAEAERQHKLGLAKTVLAATWRALADNADELDAELPRHAMKRLLYDLLAKEVGEILRDLEQDAQNLGLVERARARAEDKLGELRSRDPGDTPAFAGATDKLRGLRERLRQKAEDLHRRADAAKRRTP